MMIRSRRGRRCQDCVFFLLAALSVTGFRGSNLEDGGGGATAESTAGSSPTSAMRRRGHNTAGYNRRSQDRLGVASSNADRISSSITSSTSTTSSGGSVSFQPGPPVKRSSRSNSPLGGGVPPLYVPFVDWDPPPLLPGWWRSLATAAPTKRQARPMHELCAASTVKVYMPDVRVDFLRARLNFANGSREAWP